MIRSARRSSTILFVCFAALAPGEVPGADRVPLKVPAESTIPGGPEGDAVRLGRSLVNDTKKLLPDYVGNGLACTNCHLEAGTTAGAGPFVGLWGVFPEYSSRSGRVNSMQERINDCFERSMNGRALPSDSKAMIAILTYIRWLSTGVPVGVEVVGRGMPDGDTALEPNATRGKVVYAEKCASCHGANGGGISNPAGGYFFPPVWGSAAFNVGAGMARTYTAAGFIRQNMPLGQGGSLSDQEAVDVAQYITHQPRPAYAAGKNDYAKGGKPKDARN